MRPKHRPETSLLLCIAALSISCGEDPTPPRDGGWDAFVGDAAVDASPRDASNSADADACGDGCVDAAVFSCPAGNRCFYVSNAGDDSADGLSADTPWQTLPRVNQQSLAPGDHVLLRRGDTFRGFLTVTESGTAGQPITFASYGSGARPTITGLTEVVSWTDQGNNIWESTQPVSTLSTCNLVVVNGVNVPRGRHPNQGYFTVDSHLGATSLTSADLGGSIDWTGAEIAVKKKRWIIDRMRVTSQSGQTLTTSGPNTYDYADGRGFFIQDDVRTLDQQNEWTFNPTTGKLSIYSTTPPSGVELSTVETFAELQYIDYVTFSDIRFVGANEHAIFLKTTKFITVQNADFLLHGRDAIAGIDYLDGEPTSGMGCVIENSTFDRINNNAISLSGEYGALTIRNNRLTNIASHPGMGASGDGTYSGIRTQGDDTSISYNTLTNVGYQPISFDGDHSAVYRNVIDTYCTVKDDGAGIYTARPKADRSIVENIILNGVGAPDGNPPAIEPWDISGAVEGIYLDDDSEQVTVQHNTVYNVENACLFLHRNAGENDIQHNTFYDCRAYSGMVNFQSEDPAVPQRDNIFQYNRVIAAVDGQIVLGALSANPDLDLLGDFDFNHYGNVLGTPQIVRWRDSTMGNSQVGDLAAWQTFSGLDPLSSQFTESVASTSDVHFEYNASDVPVTIALPWPGVEVDGTQHVGSVTLAPYRSIVLLKVGP